MHLRIFPAGVLAAALLTPVAAAQPDLAELQKMTARFAPTRLEVDVSRLSAGDRKALVKLIEASRVLDELYQSQVWAGNSALRKKLAEDPTDLGKARLRLFQIEKSPWSSLDGGTPFLPDVPAKKPPGANFYPEDMTKLEFEAWKAKLPEDKRKEAEGFFTVIRRGVAPLAAVKYKNEYQRLIMGLIGPLVEAKDATGNASLKKFLDLRVKGLLTNNYYESDLAWMELDAPIDVTFGPYETYTDELFGYKAAFEAYVSVRDDKETKKLEAFSKHLQTIEDNLPIDASYRNPKLGAQAPIRVVNEVFGAGDGNHGVQTAAYNLPNDERVISEKGSKRVMLKNVQRAKFDKTLVPIAKKLLSPAAQTDLSFDWFFTHILAHELTHGLGPHQIKVGGAETTPRKELKDLYSAVEEAKADATGLFALQLMMDKGLAGLAKGPAAERQLYTTFLASCFRTLRFGVTDSHARGMAMQVNALLDKKAFTIAKDGTFAVDFTKVKGAVKEVTRDLLMLEAKGDHAGAKKMLDELGKVRPEVQKALDSLAGVPTDIEPIFVTADALVKSNGELPAKAAAPAAAPKPAPAKTPGKTTPKKPSQTPAAPAK